MCTQYLPTVVFMEPFLLWLSAFSAVLAGLGRTPPEGKKKYPEDCLLPGFEPNVFSFIGKLLSHLRFKILPEKLRKEGSIPIMQLVV